MGYYVNGTGHLVIRAANLDNAYEALMKLQDAPDNAKRGGLYSGGKHVARWFSWMPEDLRTLPDAKAVFEALGFETMTNESGDLVISCYDNKTGQEEVFFAAAAMFIEDGEYEWQGEDGESWLWEFSEGRMYVRHGRVEYGGREELSVGAWLAEQAAFTKSVEASFAERANG